MNLKEERDFWRKRALDLELKRDMLYLYGIPMKAFEELRAKCEAELNKWYNATYLAYCEADMYNKEIWKILYNNSLYEEDQIEFWKNKYNEAKAKKIKKGHVRFDTNCKN
jgi:hypothetical protein